MTNLRACTPKPQNTSATATKSSQTAVITGMVIAMFVCGLDASIVNIMLPTLQTVFKISVSQSMMLATIYLTMFASLQLLFGRSADIFDASKVFLSGIVLFLSGSVGCALSQTFTHILVGRFVQGIGGAMLAASFGAMILTSVSREKTGSTIGLILMVMSCGTIIGPPLGGYLAEALSWHWAFIVNVPLCLISIFALSIHIKRTPAKTQKSFREKLSHLDMKGGCLSILMFSSLPLALSQIADAGRQSWKVGGFFAVFLISLTLFIIVEKRATYPLVKLSLLRDQKLNLLLAIKLLLFIMFNGIMIVFPFFLTRSIGMTSSEAGVMMLANALAMAAGTYLGGQWTDRSDGKAVLGFSSAGLLLVAAGALMIQTTPSPIVLALELALFGATVAVVMVSSTTILLERAPRGQEGIFSGMNSLSVSVGGSLGLSIFSSLYMAGAMGEKGVAAANGGFSSALTGITICAALLLACSVSFINKKGEIHAPENTTSR